METGTFPIIMARETRAKVDNLLIMFHPNNGYGAVTINGFPQQTSLHSCAHEIRQGGMGGSTWIVAYTPVGDVPLHERGKRKEIVSPS
jgi:hypothetical protein